MSVEKTTLIQKLAKAKDEIKSSKLKKEGKNTFSNYEYFTPAQIESLVLDVCLSQRLLTKFDLIRNELGVYGTLTIYDLDGIDSLVYTMASAIPEIKATNVAQQLGGCVTYTERYLKTSAFGITDINLDFDNRNHLKKGKEEMMLEWVNLKEIFEQKKDKISPEQIERAEKVINEKETKSYQKLLTFLTDL